MKEPTRVVGRDGKSYPARAGTIDHAEIVRLREAGLSQAVIAQRMGCSMAIVSKVLHKARENDLMLEKEKNHGIENHD